MRVISPPAYASTANKLQELLRAHAPGTALYWAQRVPSSALPTTLGIHTILSKPAQLAAFRAAGLNTPNYTTNIIEAMRWLQTGARIVGRTNYGTQGQGIVSPGRLWRAYWTGARARQPLWINPKWRQSEWWSTLLSPQEDYTEYRFHIVGSSSIQRAQKVHTSPELQGILPIRNRRNGWTFVRDCLLPNESIREVAKAAVRAVGYPWGAVDIIYIPSTQTSYVLEVNTAPGMDNRTAELWANAIRSNYLQGLLQ